MSVKLMATAFAAHFHDIEFAHNKTKRSGELVEVQVKVMAATAKWVVVALADHANDEGEGAYPSVDTLVEKTDLSRVSVVNALKALKQEEIIVYVGLSKRKTSNYAINVKALEEMANNKKQVRPRPKGLENEADTSKATLLVEEASSKVALLPKNDTSKATLPPPVKPLYQTSKATLPESSLTVLNHPFCADAQNPSAPEKPTPSAAWGADWQMAAGAEKIQFPNADEQTALDLINALNLFHEPEKPYVRAFYLATNILPIKGDVAYWRKSISYMLVKRVTPEDLSVAAREAFKGGMTVSSPKSLEKYAVDAHARAARRPSAPPTTTTEFTRHLDGFVPRQ